MNYLPNNSYPRLVCVVGTNGTGKTTFVHDVYANNFKENNPKRNVWFVDFYQNIPNPNPKFIYLDDFDYDNWHKLRYGLLVIDDVRMFFNKNDEPQMRTMFIQRRHACLDMVLIYHSLAEVHRIVYRYATDYYIFRTYDNYDYIKNRIGNDLINEKVVNKARKLDNYFYMRISAMKK